MIEGEEKKFKPVHKNVLKNVNRKIHKLVIT